MATATRKPDDVLPHGPVHPEQGWTGADCSDGYTVEVWPLSLRDALHAPAVNDVRRYCIDGSGDREWWRLPIPEADMPRLVALWAELSRDPDPPDPDGDDGPPVEPADSWGRLLATLIADGHNRRDMLEDQQEGAPYRGWSVAQARYWARHARWRRAQAHVQAASAVADGTLLTDPKAGAATKARLEAQAYRG